MQALLAAAAALLLIATPSLAVERDPSGPECRIGFEPHKKGMPRFEQFHVDKARIAKPARVKLDTAFAREFRTALRKAQAAGPNFAGHYTVVGIGCGTSCELFAVVDALTGEVFVDPGFKSMAFDYLRQDQDKDPIYRADSALLVAVGWPEKGDEGVSYYRWTGSRFVRLAVLPIPEGCDPTYDKQRKAAHPVSPRPR